MASGRSAQVGGAVATGGAVGYAHGFEIRGEEYLFVQAGRTIHSMSRRGDIVWSAGTLGVSRVLGIVRAGPQSGPAAIVICGKDRVHLIDLRTGDSLWQFRAPTGCDLSGPGSMRLVHLDGRELLVIAPSYSTTLECFDLGRRGIPERLWDHDFGDTMDAGFGPIVVSADVLGTGTAQLVVSTRTGSKYEEGDSAVSSERLVLGRQEGMLYQAILDIRDGRLLRDTAYRPDDGPYPCARPYGLFHAIALQPDARPDLVLVSCQVEEYVSVTATGDSLSRRWGWFVEKDWPIDNQELRPQITSLADVLGDGSPLLIVGHWDGHEWSTLAIDPMTGSTEGRGFRLPGRYFWGCEDLDGDGVPELVLSVEADRAPQARTVLEIIDARTREVIDRKRDVRIVTSGDSELPEELTFHAERRGCIAVADERHRRGLVLVDERERTVWWALSRQGPAEERILWHRPTVRVDDRSGRVCLTDDENNLLPLRPDLAVESVIGVEGRRSQPLLWAPEGLPQLVVETGSGHIEGWDLAEGTAPVRVWTLKGRLPALHSDELGIFRLVHLAAEDGGDVIRAHRMDGGVPVWEFEKSWPVPVDGLLCFGGDFRVLVNQRTGVHTAAISVLDSDATVLWSDADRGAHASQPLAYPSEDGSWRVAYDDHGVLSVRVADTGELRLEDDWTAAYTTPIIATARGKSVLVRADGTHGVELLNADGDRLWRRNYPLFTCFPGGSSLVTVGSGEDRDCIALTNRDGSIDLLRLSNGELVRSWQVGEQAEPRPILTLAAQNGDLVVVGLRSGEVVALDAHRGDIVWSVTLPAAVEGLAALSQEASCVVAAASADGRVTLLTVEA